MLGILYAIDQTVNRPMNNPVAPPLPVATLRAIAIEHVERIDKDLHADIKARKLDRPGGKIDKMIIETYEYLMMPSASSSLPRASFGAA
jgi:hypothetical protein